MRSITDVIRHFKQNWMRELCPEAIERACRDHGMTWRQSTLNPIVTVQVFFLQVLHGNTACAHLPHLSNLVFTAAAYCKARTRLKLDVLKTLLQRSVEQLQDNAIDKSRWFGHRVFLVDGSSFSMPDTDELQEHFGQPGGQRAGCGFPTAHWLAMMHAGTGMITKMLAAPLRTHDLAKTAELHPELRANDVLVADRGFCSFAHFALLLQRGTHGVLRIHQRLLVDFTPGRTHTVPGKGKSCGKKGLPRSRWLRQLGNNDQVVEWFKPTSCPTWMSIEQFDALPGSLVIRELRYTITQRGFRTRTITLATTLLDGDKYKSSDLATLFRDRWDIETNFGHLKTTMKMDVLKCTTVNGVLKELHVFALIYNLVRQVILIAAEQQQVDFRRISFTDALRWLQTARPGDSIPNLIVNPLRRHRLEPRVRKRRPKQYPLMKRPRCQLQNELAP
ncbi:MAG: IS4 family transposase [Planctomycetaceae bacterium]|nr:IS4 family transposase [Planctomycetaceae bacterium]MCB9921175.1 IS4 family transposase [Planctomycetaceae bacterium]MCB9924210.1 IS4 family transposase [Planctomycetaceae bacterium]MCB9924412.1 IS4 family transposase [Planctomycetaceae bacterium]MCB9924588.1 IS4 family transposase [Planctomycetaceae bacterium]